MFELVAKAASTQAKDLALHVSRMSIKVPPPPLSLSARPTRGASPPPPPNHHHHHRRRRRLCALSDPPNPISFAMPAARLPARHQPRLLASSPPLRPGLPACPAQPPRGVLSIFCAIRAGPG